MVGTLLAYNMVCKLRIQGMHAWQHMTGLDAKLLLSRPICGTKTPVWALPVLTSAHLAQGKENHVLQISEIYGKCFQQSAKHSIHPLIQQLFTEYMLTTGTWPVRKMTNHCFQRLRAMKKGPGNSSAEGPLGKQQWKVRERKSKIRTDHLRARELRNTLP